MLRIGVCEENESRRAKIEKLIEKSKVECRLILFRTKEEIKQSKEKVDIWLLDIGCLEEDGFEEILAKAGKGKKEENEEKTIVVKVGNAYHSLSARDIYFAENNGRKIILYREKDSLEFYGKMEELERELGEGFFRCHRGFLVSLSKITGYDTGNIYLKNGESVYLAKRKYGEFVKKYMTFLGESPKEKILERKGERK